MARLPTPGGDDGQWGLILNDYLAQSLNADGTLKSDIVSSANVADDALPQAKITNLTTDLSNKVSTSDARLDLNYVSTYPPQGYGFFAVSENPAVCAEPSSVGSGTVVCARVWVPANNVITNVSACVQIAGTVGGGGTNGFAVYTDAGSLVAQSTTDNTLWSSTGWKTKALSSSIAAQASGRFVYVCLLVVGYAADPEIMWAASHEAVMAANPSTTNRRSFYITGQSSFPASFNPVSAGTLNGFLPLFGLS